MVQLESTAAAQRRRLREDRAQQQPRLERRAAGGRRAEGELASAPGAIPVAGGVLSAMPFSFTFTGSYFDLTTFFARLEHFVSLNNANLDSTGRLLRLESISIAPSSLGFPDMQAEINAASYMVPPVQGVGRGRRARRHRAPARRQSTPTSGATR